MTYDRAFQLKTMWKRLLVIPVIVALLCSAVSCKKSNVPSKKEIYNRIWSEKVVHQIQQEPGVFTYEELCKSWGQPDVERTVKETLVNFRAWKYKDGYIYAVLAKDDLINVRAFGISVKQQMVYLGRDDDKVYFMLLGLKVDSIHDTDTVGFELDRFAPGEMDNVEFGDLFDIDFNGAVFQSYPGIIDVFFSITPAGKADERQMKFAEMEREQLLEWFAEREELENAAG